MRQDAKEIFASIDLPVPGNEELYERVASILGEKMAELSVAHACRDISGKQYIDLYESQKDSLRDELKQYKESLGAV